MQGVFWDSQCNFLTFDNPEERRKLWKSDRFAAARRLTVMFNEQMKNVLVASEYLSIDETLYSMRHSESIIQISQLITVYFTSH